MKLEDPRQQTVRAVFAAVKAAAKDWRRPHMGASVLGRSCDRSIWLSFRWAQDPDFEGRVLALFDRGQREEKPQVERLRAAGLEVWDVDPQTGEQYTVDLAPHLGGSADAVVRGLLEAPGTPHVIDFKTASKKKFDELLKVGAEKWNSSYVDQLQLYMHGLKLTRAVLWVVCKDDDRIHMERFDYDKARAERLVEKGKRLVSMPFPPTRISESPSWWECKFCDFHATCQLRQTEKLEMNCRTCKHSEPKDDGTWWCEHHGWTLTEEDQKKGCASHGFIEDLVE